MDWCTSESGRLSSESGRAAAGGRRPGFEPTRAPREDLVSDAERGEVVLATLQRMDEKSAGVYANAIARLRTGWTLVLQHATKTGPDQAHAARARDFVDRIWSVFEANLLSGYRVDGWLSAEQAKAGWDARGAATREDFAVVEGTGLRRLPDALNAAWSWRLDHPDADDATVTELEKATLAICRGIIDASRPTPTEGRRGSVQLPTPVSAPAQEEPKTT